MANVYNQAQQFKLDVASQQTAALIHLTNSYLQTLNLLLPAVNQLANAVALMEPPLTPNDIYQLDRYAALVTQLETEVQKLAVIVGNSTQGLQADLALKGASDALSLIDAALKGENAGLHDFAQSLNRLPVKAIENLIGFAGNGSPLAALLAENGQLTLDKALQTLVDGLVLGLSPFQNAKAFQDVFGSSLDRAIKISRTETMRAYREANRQTYNANSDVVQGYTRLATKDSRTCLACLLKDGNFYKLSQPLDEHPAGRCALVPVTRFYQPIQTGAEWFHAQNEETQKQILGPTKFDAWQDGSDLEDFIKLHKSPAWGNAWVMA